MKLLKSLKFLESLCYVVAAVVLYLDPTNLLTVGSLLALVIAALKIFGIKPEMEVKAMLTNKPTVVKARKSK